MPRRLVVIALATSLFCLLNSRRAVAAAEDLEEFAQDIVIEPGQKVGDVVCHFCSVRVQGVVDLDVVTIGGGIDIEGEVKGDAVAIGGGGRLGPRAKVGGEVVTLGGPVAREAGASVKDEVESAPWAYLPGQRQLFLRSVVTLLGVNVGLMMLAALILRRRRVEVMASVVRQRYVLAGVLGAAALALFVILVILFGRAGRAQPALTWAAVGTFSVTLLGGGAGLSCSLGGAIPGLETWGRRVLVGALFLAGLQLIPVAGMLVFVVLLIVAPGIALLSGFGMAEDWLPGRLRRRRRLVSAAGSDAARGE